MIHYYQLVVDNPRLAWGFTWWVDHSNGDAGTLCPPGVEKSGTDCPAWDRDLHYTHNAVATGQWKEVFQLPLFAYVDGDAKPGQRKRGPQRRANT